MLSTAVIALLVTICAKFMFSYGYLLQKLSLIDVEKQAKQQSSSDLKDNSASEDDMPSHDGQMAFDKSATQDQALK